MRRLFPWDHPDDARRPITFAEAQAGVAWDTTGLPAGPYGVHGYTWHPPFNISGVVHVVDSPDPATAPPTAAVTNREEYVFVGDTLMVTGCARAQVERILGVVPPAGRASNGWRSSRARRPFMPPAVAAGQEVMLRVDVTDPQQRTFRAYPGQELAILADVGSCDHNFADCGGGDGGADSEGPTDPDDSATSTAASDGSPAGDEAGGCGCAAPASGPLRSARCCWPWCDADGRAPLRGFRSGNRCPEGQLRIRRSRSNVRRG